MKKRPMIFNTEMVRAILNGKKTVTRRPLKGNILKCVHFDAINDHHKHCPFGDIGDIGYCNNSADEKADCKCIPSIHMPRWASRITLEITEVSVEKVQDIDKWHSSPTEILSEGVELSGCTHMSYNRNKFAQLWNSIYKKTEYKWENNPYVWVIKFKKEKL